MAQIRPRYSTTLPHLIKRVVLVLILVVMVENPTVKNRIIEELFLSKNFNDCISKMEPVDLQEELKMEVIAVVCEMEDSFLIDLFDKGVLNYYVVRIILNMIKSSTSPFYKKFRNKNIQSFGSFYETDTADIVTGICNKISVEDMSFEDRFVREEMQDMALEKINSLYWYKKELILLYQKHGSFRKIEQETKIPTATIFQTIKKAFKEIREEVQSKPIFNKDELRSIQNS